MSGTHTRGFGKGLWWLLHYLNYRGNECVVWPLSRIPHTGYGVVCINGQRAYAHRVMCEFEHGPAPTPEHESAHSCNNGHLGCITPRHLSWKTRSGNQLDRRANGTHGHGSHLRYKLTPQQVDEIRGLRGKETQSAIAVRFGVSRENVCIIQAGKSWKNVVSSL